VAGRPGRRTTLGVLAEAAGRSGVSIESADRPSAATGSNGPRRSRDAEAGLRGVAGPESPGQGARGHALYDFVRGLPDAASSLHRPGRPAGRIPDDGTEP